MNWIQHAIHAAKEDNVSELDLSIDKFTIDKEFDSQGVLRQFPVEILELKHLKRLDLSGHSIDEIPPEIIKLENLAELTVSRNYGIKLPHEIRKLSNLLRLDVGSTGITELQVSILPTQLETLDLSFNDLTSLPKAITRLSSLRKLELLGNGLVRIPPQIHSLSRLQQLSISCKSIEQGDLLRLARRNALQSLFLDMNLTYGDLDEIAGWESLEELNLWTSGLSEIPKGVFHLPRLRSFQVNLSIRRPSGKRLLDTIKNLSDLSTIKSLRELDLSGIRVSEHIHALTSNSELTSLHLNEGITGFPSDVLKLAKLESLLLIGCGITTIPREISELRSLKSLNLSSNPIMSLPVELGQLSNLESLWLAFTTLTSIPSSLARLKKLQALSFHGADLNQWPEVISEIESLETITLSDTKIKFVPASVSRLKNLRALRMEGTKITKIPKEVAFLPKLRDLDITVDSITDPPPEIVARGMEAIQGYFTALLDAEAEQLFEAKLIIVGEGEVGKTCLAHKLINPSFDIVDNKNRVDTTLGVEIRDWLINTPQTQKFKVNIWDFGGQEIYHATHQFFLTKRSLYLFVWDARKEDRLGGFDYWLNVVKLLSANSPILVVLNKADVRIREIDQASLQQKFPNVIRFLQVSALTGQGIAELTEEIRRTISTLPHVGDRWPGSWSRIRRHLEQDERDYIDYEEYLGIAKREGLDQAQADLLSNYLHDLGVVLHFQDDVLLHRIVILRPEWGTNAVYAVLDTKEVQQNNGRFSFSDLKQIWSDTAYPPTRHAELLQLMVRFELSFQLGDTRDFIIPELLPAGPPAFEWNDHDNLRFEYVYDFMPAGIITRFIARNHDRIDGQAYWRYGVVLTWEGTQAQITSDPRNRRIQIKATGEDRKGLLGIIRREFAYIHRTLNDPDAKQMVPCVCDVCRVNPPAFFDYEVLRKYRSKGIKEIRCERSLEVVSVNGLLNGIYTNQEIEPGVVPTIAEATESGRVYFVQHYHENKGDSMPHTHNSDRRRSNNPWISGGFYLVALLVLIAGLGALGKWVSPVVLPVIVVGGLLSLSVVGAFQLKQDERLSEKGFLQLMGLSLRRLPLLRNLSSPRADGNQLPRIKDD